VNWKALACALLAVLLAFLHTGIAGQKAIFAKSRANSGLKRMMARERPMRTAPALPADAAALGRDEDVHLLGEAGELQRLSAS